MIETIFYFADDQALYNYNRENGNIAPRTISFVPKDQNRGNIYRDGKRYGGVDADLDSAIIESIVKGFMNDGDLVFVKPLLTTGTPIALITVGDTTKTLYAPNKAQDPNYDPDEPVDPNYDPVPTDEYEKWVKEQIIRMKETILNEKDRIKDYISDKDTDIRDLVEHMFEDYQDLIQHYIDTGNPDYQNFTFGNEDTMEWISTLGHVTDNGDGTYNVNWSDILQTISLIKADVNQIKANPGEGGVVDYEALSAGVYAAIENDIAQSGLNSNWVRLFGGDWDSDDRTILEWMAADVKTWANSQRAFSDVMAAAREYAEDGKTVLQEAAAGVHALVEKQPDGTYKASSALSALVDDAYAGVTAQALKDEAMAQFSASMTSEINGKVDEVFSGLRSEVQRILNSLGNYDYVTSNTLASTVDDIYSAISTKASYSDIEQYAETAVSAAIGDYTSGLDAYVKKTSDGHLESGVKVYGDKIDLTGNHSINLTANDINLTASDLVNIINSGTTKLSSSVLNVDADSINLTASKLVQIINDGSTKIAASKLNLSGSDIVDIISSGSAKIAAKNLTFDVTQIDVAALGGNETLINALNSNLNVKSLSAGSNGTTVTANSTGIKVASSSKTAAEFKPDGSGSVANGAISWNASGDITFDEVTLAKLRVSQSILVGDYKSAESGIIINIALSSGIGRLDLRDVSNNTTLARLAAANGSGIFYLNDGDGDSILIGGASIEMGDTASYGGSVASSRVKIYSGSSLGLLILSGTGTVSLNNVGAGCVYMSNGTTSCSISPNGTINSSDMRLKNVIEDKNITAQLIADAPIFVYNTIGGDGTRLIGTSAQYWLDILPETVSEIDNYLGLDYTKVAIASVINLAKEVVTLKEEKATLIERIEALEARLQLIENKLNA